MYNAGDLPSLAYSLQFCKPNAETSVSETQQPGSSSSNTPLNINLASVSDIVSLKGVGQKLAEKLIELRQSQPFTSYDDLNARVKIVGGKWESYNLSFSIDD